MCMLAYLASAKPLPLIPWSAEQPAFHVTQLPDDRAEVRRQFSLPHVYYAGSHEKCGCGFQYGEYELDDPDADELAEIERNKQSRARLADYLQSALKDVPRVELYACWDGDESLPREHEATVCPQALIEERPFFRERELVVVTEQPIQDP